MVAAHLTLLKPPTPAGAAVYVSAGTAYGVQTGRTGAAALPNAAFWKILCAPTAPPARSRV